MNAIEKVRVIDSHTAGEPTRIIAAGGPELGQGRLSERRDLFRSRFDHFRSAVVNEPRGSDVLVGGLIVPPYDESCATGVIFFNNVGYLGMCGHGTIGLVTTLAYLEKIEEGEHRIETVVGVVKVTLHADGSVSVLNVPSYRTAKEVQIDVPGIGKVTGDVAWGGNWFFLITQHEEVLTLENLPRLLEFSSRVRRAVNAHGFTAVDHVELFGPPTSTDAHSRNFVLCPGNAHDRSPCGTGTSAKLACLFSDGKIREGEVWRQESITGSIFEASVAMVQGEIVPMIKGRAFVTAETTLILDDADPLCWGVSAASAQSFSSGGGAI